MKFVFNRDRAIPIATVGLLAASFFILGINLPVVHAASPTVNHTGSSNCSPCTTNTVGLTVTSSGDVIVVTVNLVNNGPAVRVTVNSISDTFGNAFLQQADLPMWADNIVSACNTTLCGDIQIFTATTTTTGADTITVTNSGDTPNPGMELGSMDVTGINPSVVTYGFFQCTTANAPITTCLSGSSAVTNPVAFGPNTVELGVGNVVDSNYQLTAGSAAWTLFANSNGIGSSEWTTSSTAGNLSPAIFPFSKSASGGVTYWEILGVVFGPSSGVTTVTTVINTGCLGACSGGNNGTSYYLPPSLSTFFNLHFYASQNIASAAQIDNVTLKVAAVHINTPTGTLYVCEWGTTGIPTGGNPYTLIQNCFAKPIINGTSNFFIHVNPQANLAASAYYAVGIMATTTASRGSGASASGISVYEVSAPTSAEYKYAVGSATPPTQFFSSLLQTPYDWIYIHTTFTVAILTSTSTLTLSGVVTSTSTTTSTSTLVVNQGDPTKPAFWYMPMFFMLLFVAIFLGAYGMVNAVTQGRLRIVRL